MKKKKQEKSAKPMPHSFAQFNKEKKRLLTDNMNLRLFQLTVANAVTPPKTNNLVCYLTNLVLNMLDVNKLFPTLQSFVNESFDPRVMESPHSCLAKVIVARFFKVRCLSYCGRATEALRGQASNRNKRHKLTQFEGL